MCDVQMRKTGEPYVTHCIETALIVESNLPHWRQDSRCGFYAALLVKQLLRTIALTVVAVS
jgi:(p)ppGpp synthase/HD superfamily hydrolase